MCDARVMDRIDTEEPARRLALAILADLELYGAGGDASDESASVQEARTLYRSRVSAGLHPVFEEVLQQRQRLFGSRAGAPPIPAARVPKRAVIVWVLAGVVAIVGGALLVRIYRAAGDEVGTVAIPGAVDVVLRAGDRLSFTADTDVLFRDFRRNATPKGCNLDLVLTQDDREIGRTACDLYSSGTGLSVARSSSYATDDATGMRRLAVEGQRLTCAFGPVAIGRVTVRASSNLSTCVPRVVGAVAHISRVSSD